MFVTGQRGMRGFATGGAAKRGQGQDHHRHWMCEGELQET
jgi:hypothetical protein